MSEAFVTGGIPTTMPNLGGNIVEITRKQGTVGSTSSGTFSTSAWDYGLAFVSSNDGNPILPQWLFFVSGSILYAIRSVYTSDMAYLSTKKVCRIKSNTSYELENGSIEIIFVLFSLS